MDFKISSVHQYKGKKRKTDERNKMNKQNEQWNCRNKTNILIITLDVSDVNVHQWKSS